MKVLIITHNWGKSWVDLYINSFRSQGCDVGVWDGKADLDFNPKLVVCTWADKDYTSMFPDADHVMMMRRFEFFHSPWRKYNWGKIKLLVCCNPFIANQVSEEIRSGDTTIMFARNSIDVSKWTFAKRSHGNKIGMTCRIFPIKNLPLAAYILRELPKQYSLHIAGPIQDLNVLYYMKHMLGNRVEFYGDIPRQHLDEWWEDKSYCLSTSISEGDPMGVMEAMAKGIKPVIHNWPGADELYPEVFENIDEAVSQITEGDYQSSLYREEVEKNNSIQNIEFVTQLSLGKGDLPWKVSKKA